MKIPIMKAIPEMILELLKCIEENEGNVFDMKNCIHDYLQRFSGKEMERNIRSDVYGITLPSLRKLQLVIDHGNFIRLNSNGRLLLRSYFTGGFDDFKYQFGRIVYEIDERKCKVISSLIEVSSRLPKQNAVADRDLLSSLLKRGVETYQRDERLRKWLPFLEYVNLIEIKNKDRFQVNIELVENYKLKRAPASFELFEKILFEEYGKLKVKESIYVPIYMLREKVCNLLIEKGYSFNTFDFELFLVAVLNKYSTLKRKKILLSQPGKREEEGMYIEDTYYYFISIYDIKEDKA